MSISVNSKAIKLEMDKLVDRYYPEKLSDPALVRAALRWEKLINVPAKH